MAKVGRGHDGYLFGGEIGTDSGSGCFERGVLGKARRGVLLSALGCGGGNLQASGTVPEGDGEGTARSFSSYGLRETEQVEDVKGGQQKCFAQGGKRTLSLLECLEQRVWPHRLVWSKLADRTADVNPMHPTAKPGPGADELSARTLSVLPMAVHG